MSTVYANKHFYFNEEIRSQLGNHTYHVPSVG